MPVLAAFMVPHPPMIVPQVGRGSEKMIEETVKAYDRVADEIAKLCPETIIITSPHTVMYSDYFHISPGDSASGSFKQFGAPQVSFEEKYDTELREALCACADEANFPAGSSGERSRKLDHATLVPLWFIHKKYNDFKIIRIGLSGLPLSAHYRLGILIKEAVEKTGRRAVFVASGDLSHRLKEDGPYGFIKEGPEYDERVMKVCAGADFGALLEFDEVFCEKAAECGHRSFVIMAGALDGMKVRAEKLSHEDITGVGYGICSFYPEGEDEERHFLEKYLMKVNEKTARLREKEDPYVKLARKSLESYILRGQVMKIPEGLPEEMLSTKAGAFVSIHKHGYLRGCIGTIGPVRPCVAQEIIDNAVSAAVRDPRFDPVRPDELSQLEINVDVLGEPEDISSPDELDVKKYGVIVTCGFKRGLLLPDIEGVDTVEQQIDIARKKAGIGRREDYTLQRFEVIRHK